MEHNPLKSDLSTAERSFLDLMNHGDNFFRIELFRPAKRYYKKALELNLQTENVQKKIAECDRLLAFEVKVIWILVAIAATFVLTLWIL